MSSSAPEHGGKAAGGSAAGAAAAVKTWLVGVGSPLRGDDRVGLEVAKVATDRLLALGKQVSYFEVGGDPMALLAEMERMQRMVIVDAADMGEPGGTVRALGPQAAIEAIRKDPLIMHGFGLGEILRLARQGGFLPEFVRIVGIQPERFEMMDESLSPVLQREFSRYVDITCQEVLGNEKEDSDHRR